MHCKKNHLAVKAPRHHESTLYLYDFVLSFTGIRKQALVCGAVAGYNLFPQFMTCDNHQKQPLRILNILGTLDEDFQSFPLRMHATFPFFPEADSCELQIPLRTKRSWARKKGSAGAKMRVKNCEWAQTLAVDRVLYHILFRSLRSLLSLLVDKEFPWIQVLK
jgi:hypothetical protein